MTDQPISPRLPRSRSHSHPAYTAAAPRKVDFLHRRRCLLLGTMPSSLAATTAYAAYALSALTLCASLTSAHAHGPSALGGRLGKRTPVMTYSGCYSSSTGLSDQGSYTYQTPSYCQPICVAKNQAVFGLSQGSNCWCGDELPPASSKVDDSNCNAPCNGYGQDDCGYKLVTTRRSSG